MKDNEFNEYYIKAEEWPGQKDEVPAKDEEPLCGEAATLQEISSAESNSSLNAKTAQAKKARRKKEAMLNKSTGLLAGAVAVAVVAGTLSARTLEPVIRPVEASYICPICSVENCELWDVRNEKEVTRIELEGDNYTIWSGNENQLGIQPIPLTEGMWREVENRTSAIRMQDGSRAYIQYVPEEYIEYDMLSNTGDDDRECLVPATEMMIREAMCAGALSGEGEKHITLIELIYMPDGTKPQEENLTYELNGEYVADLPYVYSKTIPNTENLWLRISTTEKTLDMVGMWKDTKVKVVDADVREIELGNTMVFTEDAKHACTWYSSFSRAHSMGWGANYKLYYEFEKMRYDFIRAGEQVEDLYMFYITFVNATYEQVFDRWQELNKLAAKRGHNVWIPVYQLEDYKCNGITYQIYLLDKISELNNVSELYCVPVQEMNVAIRIPFYNSDEKMSTVQNRVHLRDALSDSDYEQTVQLLDNIYLR